MLETTVTRVAGIDEAFALRFARAIERDPSLLDVSVDLVREVSAFPKAREVINRVFRASRKVAFRYQRARHVAHVSVTAFA